MNHDDTEDDGPATRIASAEGAGAGRGETTAAVALDGPTRQFVPPKIEATRAMPAGYGASRFVPPPRPSAPRPAAGRPAVPSLIDDPLSASDMTLIERIDAELESVTAELSIPEGLEGSLLDEPSAGAEATIRLAVPDDLPRDLLERPSAPGAPPPPPSLSAMPTPALPFDVEGSAPAPSTSASPASVASPSAPDADRLAAARAPAPRWVGPYLFLCLVVSLLGGGVLAWLKVERHW